MEAIQAADAPNFKPLKPALKPLGGNVQPQATRAELREASRQFEAMMLRQVLKDGMKPMFKGYLDTSNQAGAGVYQDMIVNQMAETLSKGQGLGVAGVFEQQVGKLQPLKDERNSAHAGQLRGLSSAAAQGSGLQPLQGMPRTPAAPQNTALPPAASPAEQMAYERMLAEAKARMLTEPANTEPAQGAP